MKSDAFPKMQSCFDTPSAEMLINPKDRRHQEIMISRWAREKPPSGIPYVASIRRQQNGTTPGIVIFLSSLGHQADGARKPYYGNVVPVVQPRAPTTKE
jgi:hypothetical protein